MCVLCAIIVLWNPWNEQAFSHVYVHGLWGMLGVQVSVMRVGVHLEWVVWVEACQVGEADMHRNSTGAFWSIVSILYYLYDLRCLSGSLLYDSSMLSSGTAEKQSQLWANVSVPLCSCEVDSCQGPKYHVMGSAGPNSLPASIPVLLILASMLLAWGPLFCLLGQHKPQKGPIAFLVVCVLRGRGARLFQSLGIKECAGA